MGLDMYLTRKYYVKNWDHYPKERRWDITIKRGGKPAGIDKKKLFHVETEEIYWRKANQIHKWFVDNVQKGVDDCGTYYVEREQLQELLDVVTKVLEQSVLVPGKVTNGYTIDDKGKMKPCIEKGKVIKDPATAESLLPTAMGCFFGGTGYDEWYYQDLEHTKKELTRILSEEDKESGDFYYHSSW